MDTVTPTINPPLDDAQIQEALDIANQVSEKVKMNPPSNPSYPSIKTNKKIQPQPVIFPEIYISITQSYIKKEGFLSGYTVYIIQGQDEQGIFRIERRYSDFEKLREVMVSRHPGCSIPELPWKGILPSTNSSVMKKREIELADFLWRVVAKIYLYYSEEFQLFLRCTDADFYKKLESMKQKPGFKTSSKKDNLWEAIKKVEWNWKKDSF